jgi:hypothetical protein
LKHGRSFRQGLSAHVLPNVGVFCCPDVVDGVDGPDGTGVDGPDGTGVDGPDGAGVDGPDGGGVFGAGDGATPTSCSQVGPSCVGGQ